MSADAAAGVRLGKCFVMHVNNQYVRRGEIDPARFFILADVTREATALQQEIPDRVSRMRRILALGRAPGIPIGPHCSAPYDCEFIDHCWKHIPEYSVFDLVRARHEKVAALADRGILHVRDVPEDVPLTEAQALQVAVERSGRPHIDREGIARILRVPRHPLHFLDFETIGAAIPPYDGLRPFQQLPFQASIHVQNGNGAKAEHLEYLGDARTDPRPGLVAFLAESIGSHGSVVAYNAPFEGTRLSELAEAYPRHAKPLLSIRDRLWDLAGPFRMGLYVHPGFRGSWSIKAVLPALVPGMAYDGMPISDGGEASAAYLSLMEGHLPPAEARRIARALKDYCRRDTLGMVKLLGVLQRAAGVR